MHIDMDDNISKYVRVTLDGVDVTNRVISADEEEGYVFLREAARGKVAISFNDDLDLPGKKALYEKMRSEER